MDGKIKSNSIILSIIFKPVIYFLQMKEICIRNSQIIHFVNELKEKMKLFFLESYQKSYYKKLLKSMLRQLIYVRRNSLNSIFVSLILKIFIWFYINVYQRIYDPLTIQNSRFVKSSKELEWNIKNKPVSYTGKLIFITVIVNTVMYLLTDREIDWVGWYFRTIWTITALIMMSCSFRFKDLTEGSKMYPYLRKKFIEIRNFLNMES